VDGIGFLSSTDFILNLRLLVIFSAYQRGQNYYPQADSNGAAKRITESYFLDQASHLMEKG
jgi:hypothetical protein